MTDEIGEAPHSDEAELSVFGPGFGECLLVHLGDGEWLLVDSCVDQRRREQPALAYLERIGVDPARAVKLVVATHWHDDHIRGLADVVATCVQAPFVFSAAFRRTELVAAIRALRRGLRREQSGVAEINGVFDVLEANGRRYHVAAPNRGLFRAERSSGRVQVTALSPSDEAIVLAAGALLSGPADDPARGLVAPRPPNHCAVVLQVDLPGGSLLLGADLEETTNPAVGWTAILQLDPRPTARSQVFKVPHHGSKTGHHDQVWEEMLISPIYAGLTPYARGKQPLPTAEDIERITARADYAYITSDKRRPQPPKRDPTVERQLREVALRRVQAEPLMGQIRFRRPMGVASPGAWAVTLLGAARELRTLA